MKAEITKASNSLDIEFREFETMQDLIDFVKEIKTEIIIDPVKPKNADIGICIYDDYIE